MLCPRQLQQHAWHSFPLIPQNTPPQEVEEDDDEDSDSEEDDDDDVPELDDGGEGLARWMMEGGGRESKQQLVVQIR